MHGTLRVNFDKVIKFFRMSTFLISQLLVSLKSKANPSSFLQIITIVLFFSYSENGAATLISLSFALKKVFAGKYFWIYN